MSDDHRTGTVTTARAPGRWGIFAVATGALFLEGIDIAMLNVAVPSIARDIGLATGSAHWVISAYVLAYAGFMILGERVADLLGRRRVFLVAFAVFIVFSAVGGLAQDAWLLIVARFVTGATAGFMTPAGLSLLTTSFPPGALRNRALSIYGAVGASGFYLGVVAGGLLTSAGWRWVFFAPVLFGTAVLLTGMRFLPRDRTSDPAPARTGSFDLGGAFTLTSAMVVLVFGVVTLGQDRSSSIGLAAVLAATVLLASFVGLERRVARPLIPAGVLTQGLLPGSRGGRLARRMPRVGPAYGLRPAGPRRRKWAGSQRSLALTRRRTPALPP